MLSHDATANVSVVACTAATTSVQRKPNNMRTIGTNKFKKKTLTEFNYGMREVSRSKFSQKSLLGLQ